MRDRASIYVVRAASIFAVLIISALLFLLPTGPMNPPSGQLAAAIVSSPFRYTFNAAGVLNEAGSLAESTSPYWWLNSGGELIIESGLGKTMQGDAPLLNTWRILYALSNSLDTDGGRHPQNLFRLVSKSSWNNVEVSARFLIAADNLSASPNRNQSNGLLLMSRYTGDGQTLYYEGIRVDGTAVIKKKYHGTYYTMAQATLYPGTYAIAAGNNTSQNLLPHGEWIALKSSTVTNADGSVTISLFMQDTSGSWKKVLQAVDRGDRTVGYTPPITGSRYVGVRTDFMDVSFGSIQMTAL